MAADRITYALSLLLAGLFLSSASAQNADIRPLLLNNVVRIYAPSETGPPMYGYGLIVSREGDTLWIATAKHVVHRDATADSAKDYASAAVYLYGSANSLPIEAEPRWAAKLDIAFLPVYAPLAENQLVDAWRSAVVAPEARDNESASLLGTAGDSIDVAAGDGRLKLSRAAAVPDQLPAVMVVAGLNGYPGQSGAPLATNQGVVGIYSGSGVNGVSDAQVISIAAVKGAAESRSVPWQLTDNVGSSPYTTNVCIRSLGAEHPTLLVGGQSASLNKDGTVCVRVRAGTETIYSADSDFACLPNMIQLAERPLQDIAVNCNISIGGIWTNFDLGGAQITPITNGKWTFDGLDSCPYGHVSGYISGEPPQLYFDGRTLTGLPVQGLIHVDRKTLLFHLTLTRSGTPFSFSLTRP